MTRRRHAWTLLLVATLGLTSWAAADQTEDLVRRDWYFRESLAAIRDWESILGRWEQQTPETARTPVLPVPGTGEAAEWPNPIPRPLLPEADTAGCVRVRKDAAGFVIERTGSTGPATRENVKHGSAAVGYKHPGGGGKDQWYHAYHRKFDQLTKFEPRPARFALRLNAPLDLQRGDNDLALAVRNTAGQPLAIRVQAQLWLPQETRDLGEQGVSLGPGATAETRIKLRLDRPGGGLMILTVRDGDEAFWLPLLTHVEDVPAVLASIAQIVGDAPPATATERLASLQRQAESIATSPQAAPGTAWRRLFEAASRLRDELLLSRLRFDSLLFLKRKPFFSEQPFMDAHHLFNRPGGGLYRLSPVRPGGRVIPVVDTLGDGVYRDLCLHWDARRLLFAFGNGSDNWDGRPSYHLYEVAADGSGLRQLTRGPKNDCEPFYLPSGQIGFTSDRAEHFVMCGGDRHAPNLFVLDGDGADVRRLSFNVFNDYNPAVLPDGRLIYGRWEYNERSVTSLHNPFTMHPDGTMVSPYYGNATIRPNVVMFPRPVPDSTRVMALFTAHHGQTHGAVGVLDVHRGIDGPAPLTVLTPNVPITGEKAEDSRHGWFSDPLPLDESTWLCSYTPTVLPWLETTWALYVADRHGNLALVYRDPAIACAEPVPLVARRPPHVLPPAPAETGARDAAATLVVTDVYRGLTGVRRGTAKYLRILEDVPRESVHRGGVVCTSATLIFTIKRVLGAVPVEPDGSAYFTVPANRNVYFEVLDADRLEIQRMRSVVCLKPGERRSCIGCHEGRHLAPPPTTVAALQRAPSQPVPPPWGAQTLSYLRDVQPILNARCVRCHTYDRGAGGVILTDDLTDQFCIGYEELLTFVTVAISNRWDHPDDVLPRPPYTYGSKVSPLTRLLAAGHHDVKLSAEEWECLVSWIDANGVYYDRYESEHYDHRHILAPVRPAVQKVYDRRCVRCHGAGDGRHDTWWLSVNRRDVRTSRMLAAPLAPAAGGWGRCEGTVFADANDPDYQSLLATLTALRRTLDEHPREDLLSLRGSPAEQQPVVLPPPPQRKATPEEPSAAGVDLLSLPWQSARAGWTKNNDGVPRRNRDVTDQPLRLGSTRRYTRGIGTHAPSEIAYRLDGQYERFTSTVGGGERGGTVVFQVFGDDRKLFDSGILHGLEGVQRVDVPVAGVRVLRLVVTDGGDGYIADMANWANPRLVPAGSAGVAPRR